MKRKVNIQDIANALNISRNTVSKPLMEQVMFLKIQKQNFNKKLRNLVTSSFYAKPK